MEEKERMDLEEEYSRYFTEFFENVKEEHRKSIGYKEDNELSSGDLAFRDAISLLPCPVSVVRLIVDLKKYREAENNVYHLESALRNRYSEICCKPRKFIGLDVIIRKLVEEGIIPKGETKIYNAGRYLRNALSHLTNPSIMTPNSNVLEKIAYQINQIYDR